jgi:hypothetical protein
MKPQRLFLLLVVVLIAMTATWTYAQVVRVDPVTPTVVSGEDVGFRIEGNRGGTPVGTLVVRMNGQWVEADLSSAGVPKRISGR